MSLRKATILIIFATFTGLFAFLYAISNYNILSSFTFLEKKFVVQNLMRGVSALQNEESELGAILADWARWDDAYAFTSEPTQAFVDSNLGAATFRDLRLSFILFFDRDRRFVTGRRLSDDEKTTEDISQAVLDALPQDSPFFEQTRADRFARGLMLLPDGPALAAMAPVLTSESKGPANGYLLMGRSFTPKQIQAMQRRARLALNFFEVDAKELPRPLRDALGPLLRTRQFQIVPMGEDAIYGFGLIEDVSGRPALAMEVSMPREIYRQGVSTLRYNFIALLIIGVSFGLAMLLLVQNRILSRITRLNNQITEIKTNKNAPRETHVAGRDEIAGLSEAINAMLREIDLAHMELRESEHRYEMATRAAKVGVWDWDLITGEFYIDPNLKAILGYEDAEIANDLEAWAAHVHPADRKAVMDAAMAYVKGRIDDYAFERRMLHRDGSIRWFYVRGKAIRDDVGAVVRFVGTETDITEIKKAEESIRNLSRELIKAQENERSRIARDLHDNVAQDLSALKIASETLLDGFADPPPEVLKRMADLSSLLQRSIAGVRDLSYDLRPPNLEYLGLTAAVERLCREFEEKNGIRVEMVSAGLDGTRLNADIDINLYRLVQEALNNVRRHAQASRVAVRMVESHPRIIVRVEDDGVGFDVAEAMRRSVEQKRMGLRSMEERVSLLGGRLRVHSAPGAGTRIIAEIPYKDWESHAGLERIDH